jgi:hypothetical protein
VRLRVAIRLPFLRPGFERVPQAFEVVLNLGVTVDAGFLGSAREFSPRFGIRLDVEPCHDADKLVDSAGEASDAIFQRLHDYDPDRLLRFWKDQRGKLGPLPKTTP